MDKIDKLLFEYREKFNEPMCEFLPPMSDEEFCAFIQECIDNNTPYEPQYEEGSVY